MTVSRKSVRVPRSAVAALQKEVGDLFERLAVLERSDRAAAGEWSPPVDVFECRDGLVVVAEVPGLALESLRVTYRERELVLSGERRTRKPAPGTGFLCVERPHGRFERSIPLDVPVDVRASRAVLGQGLLTVTLPRLKERRGRETVIPIEREPEA
jgi:HSP20 family protein